MNTIGEIKTINVGFEETDHVVSNKNTYIKNEKMIYSK